jgi:SpoVK/Ycf46/Vps4 family AAA+-type ATPase
LFGGIVGSSEENIRKTIALAEAVAPAILWVDEIEKGFTGVMSGGDSGASARVFSTFLTWLQEKRSSIFFVATANNISILPPEFLRKGRFDEIFFVDLPSPVERAEIFRIHLAKNNQPEISGEDQTEIVKVTEGFTGAEIEQIVISSAYAAYVQECKVTKEILLREIKSTFPLSKTMKEDIDNMREWAQFRARSASIDNVAGLAPDTEDRWKTI